MNNLDLSSKSLEEFVEFFFSREVVPDREQFDYFLTGLAGEKYDEAVPSSPEVLVAYMTQLFSSFGQIATKYSLMQVDQAVWGMLGANLRLYEFVFDASIPLPARLECIRSMYRIFADFVAKSEASPREELSSFWMWWDLVLHGFWTHERPVVPGTHRGDPSRLDSDSHAMLDVLFETLARILDLPNTEAQRCALHGLGHLYHPKVRAVVQQYIDMKKSEFPLAWLEECRDGDVL